MEYTAFDHRDLDLVGEALEVAEDRTGDHYKFSFAQWKRHRYDVKTLRALGKNQVSEHAFALLNKGTLRRKGYELRAKEHDFFVICLQDHQILKALERDKNMGLLPLLVYVFTHELIHIVRFSNFHQRFEASEKTREREETIVHATTYEILRQLSVPKLDYVLDSYQGHRICDTVAG
jgi:hypothetical protein